MGCFNELLIATLPLEKSNGAMGTCNLEEAAKLLNFSRPSSRARDASLTREQVDSQFYFPRRTVLTVLRLKWS
jgi:hypothetical protein